ncbi:MAG: hypothetical protein PHQ54_05250 [Candidatus Omnitrophica bacterium]|nr:hypothetical protein [Candidatus Omnitrophota bacterium]
MAPERECVKGVENEQRIIALERDHKNTSNAIAKMSEKIDVIERTLLNRPTWVVTTIITVLVALTSVSLTFAFSIIRTSMFKISGG